MKRHFRVLAGDLGEPSCDAITQTAPRCSSRVMDARARAAAGADAMGKQSDASLGCPVLSRSREAE